MNIQETAQSLIDELNKELVQKQDDLKVLQGATQGVNLLFTRIMEGMTEGNEQDSSTSSKVTSKKESKK